MTSKKSVNQYINKNKKLAKEINELISNYQLCSFSEVRLTITSNLYPTSTAAISIFKKVVLLIVNDTLLCTHFKLYILCVNISSIAHLHYG